MTIMIPAWVNGEIVPVEKLSAHQQGLKHKAVSVFVIAEGEILMQRRALSKYHTPGLWTNTCCTHPGFDESAEVCAVRRLREELGIKGLLPEHRQQLEYRADVGNGLIEHEVVDVFVAHAPASLRLRPNPDEVMEVAWMDIQNLIARVESHPDTFTPWLRIYLADHFTTIFGADMVEPARV